MLRPNSATGLKGGVIGEEPRSENKYNHNFAGHFCSCGETYDPAKEKGTMFQCLGLGTVKSGGCGEDWWHPECLVGISRSTGTGVGLSAAVKREQTNGDTLSTIAEEHEATTSMDPTHVQQQEPPLPLGFPAEDDFDHLVCYKCVESHPWLKQYAGSSGFLPPVLISDNDPTPAQDAPTLNTSVGAIKRKAEDDDMEEAAVKRTRVEETEAAGGKPAIDSEMQASEPHKQTTGTRHDQLPPAPTSKFSLFLKEDFRDHLCRCSECFPRLAKFPQLLEEEEAYEPPMSESDAEEANGGGSVSAGSLLERGEAALSTMDRMRAIGKLKCYACPYTNTDVCDTEGVMAYNHLRDRVKTFLQPFAESGQAVGAEDVKAYFAKLRGDEDAMRQAAASADGSGDGSDNRREQSGY